jgi:hypothetical protein
MRKALPLLMLLFSPLAVLGETGSHDGHEHAAPDLGNIGKVHLETSCTAAAASEIDRGTALVHSFWYGEGERSFRKAAAADPGCGMAWWGVAMANLHPIWAPRRPPTS